MSRVFESMGGGEGSFPRVSGDEPRARWPRGSSHVFSPRERG